MSDAPRCHVCGGVPVFQWSRLANEQEAEAQRAQLAVLQGRVLSDEEIAAKYGPLRVAVTGCVEHDLGDGELRALVHEADCRGHEACWCAPEGVQP